MDKKTSQPETGTPLSVDPKAIGHHERRDVSDPRDAQSAGPPKVRQRLKTAPERDESPNNVPGADKTPEQDVVIGHAQDDASGTQLDTDRYQSARRVFEKKFGTENADDGKADSRHDVDDSEPRDAE